MPPKEGSKPQHKSKWIVGPDSRTESTASEPEPVFQPRPPLFKRATNEWLDSLPSDPSLFVPNPEMVALRAGNDPQQGSSKGKGPAANQATTMPKAGGEPQPSVNQDGSSTAAETTAKQNWGREDALAWPDSDEGSLKGSTVRVHPDEASVLYSTTSKDISEPQRKKPQKKTTDKGDKDKGDGKPKYEGPKGEDSKAAHAGSTSV
jgi:hypothetical protein